MPDKSITKVSSEHAPKGRFGQKYHGAMSVDHQRRAFNPATAANPTFTPRYEPVLPRRRHCPNWLVILDCLLYKTLLPKVLHAMISLNGDAANRNRQRSSSDSVLFPNILSDFTDPLREGCSLTPVRLVDLLCDVHDSRSE